MCLFQDYEKDQKKKRQIENKQTIEFFSPDFKGVGLSPKKQKMDIGPKPFAVIPKEPIVKFVKSNTKAKSKAKEEEHPKCKGQWTFLYDTKTWKFDACDFVRYLDKDYCYEHRTAGGAHDIYNKDLEYCSNYDYCFNVKSNRKDRLTCDSCHKYKQRSRANTRHIRQLAYNSPILTCVECETDHPKEAYIGKINGPRDTKKCPDCLMEQKPKNKARNLNTTHNLKLQLGVEGYRRKFREKKKIFGYRDRSKRQAYHKDPRGKFSGKKSRTKRDGKPLHLEPIDYENFIKGDCYYCLKPSNHEDSFENLTYNTVDRVNSDIGYLKENCVSCCAPCNAAKSNWSVQVFIAHTARIVAFVDDRADIHHFYDNEPYESVKSGNYKKYIESAKSRSMEFSISEEFFDNIVKQNCYLCGNRPPTGNCGIDRFDNDVGYIESNCRTCCATCNFMKGGATYDMFIERCRNVVQRFLDYPEIFPEFLRSTRKHFGKATMFDKPKVMLTKNEESDIVFLCRVKTDILDIERSIISHKTVSKSDQKRYEIFREMVEYELKFALQKKLEAYENK